MDNLELKIELERLNLLEILEEMNYELDQLISEDVDNELDIFNDVQVYLF